jgi:hypothetical protein
MAFDEVGAEGWWEVEPNDVIRGIVMQQIFYAPTSKARLNQVVAGVALSRRSFSEGGWALMWSSKRDGCWPTTRSTHKMTVI